MGGTTAKSTLIEGGRLRYTSDYEVGAGMSASSWSAKGGGYALKLPVVDVAEVGAGGGSVVTVDAVGRVTVGPRSAGAVPGPACYALGGTEPTVTDANVVLGYLSPAGLLGGAMPIDAERATAGDSRACRSAARLQRRARRVGHSCGRQFDDGACGQGGFHAARAGRA